VIRPKIGIVARHMPMVSINLRIWFDGVELGDAGETIEREESK